MAIADHQGTVQELSQLEAREIFDSLAHSTLGMSGEQFVSAWENGAFDGDPEDPGVLQLVMLMPLGR